MLQQLGRPGDRDVILRTPPTHPDLYARARAIHGTLRAMFVVLTVALAAAAPSTAPAAAPVHSYVSTWSAPPTAIEAGHFPDAPILGNGDLGVSIGGDPAAGELSLYLGLNQLWGLKAYDRQADPSFVGDTVFPRRLGLGKITVRSPQLAALAAAVAGGTAAGFEATQSIADGVVNATLRLDGAVLSVQAFLAPDENVLVTEVRATGAGGLALHVNISSSVLALVPLTRRGNSKPELLDGKIGSGVAADGRTIYSQRQPLGASSSKPISVAVATSFADRRLACAAAAPAGESQESGSSSHGQSYTARVSCLGKLAAGAAS